MKSFGVLLYFFDRNSEIPFNQKSEDSCVQDYITNAKKSGMSVCVCRENQHMCWGVESAEPCFFWFRLGEPSDDPLPWGWERASRWCPSCPALKVTSRQGNWFHIKVGMVRMLQPTLRDRWAMNKWRKLLREDMNDIYLIISRFPTCLSLCGC